MSSTPPTFDNDIADEIAFLAIGAAAYIREKRPFYLPKYDGYIGVISEVIQHAPLLAQRWRQFGPDGFDGVWLYDVSERFGRELAESLLGGADEKPDQLLDYIINNEMEK